MTNKWRKALALMLALAMAASMAACGSSDGGSASTTAAAEAETEAAAEEAGEAEEGEEPAEEAAEGEEAAAADVDPNTKAAEYYTADSIDMESWSAEVEALYDENLGQFSDMIADAVASENVSERFAKLALAEANMLEQALMVPTTSQGGNYALSAVVPYSVSPQLWGNDAYRLSSVMVCTDLIKGEDIEALRAYWREHHGDGTYRDYAREYLTDKGYEFKDTYNKDFDTFPQTFDAMNTYRQADTEALVNTFDGLLRYDSENELQPALAESYEVSEDGCVYTFHLRQGVKWVDSQGREIGEMKADDFVAGLQHVLDAQGGLEYLVGDAAAGIVNADDYVAGTVTDFNEVGIKAVDDYTLEFTLTNPRHYFVTLLGYSVIMPMSRSYYESQGGKFGAEYNPEDPAYTYGSDQDHIAYIGPYLITNATAENTIVFQANPSYYDADNVEVKTITWLYNDGSDSLKRYNDIKSKTIDGGGLNAEAVESAKSDGLFDDYSYVSSTDATSYMGFFNLDRYGYSNFNDNSVGISDHTVESADRARAAIQNLHFRRAFIAAFDRGAYNAQSVGEELKDTSLINTYVPGNFVRLEEDVTIDGTTYAAGTYYGDIIQQQLDKDGVQVKVWDAENQTSAGFDGWYNPEYAASELEIAIEELAAEGIEVSAENPIIVERCYYSGSDPNTNAANAMKQSIETVTEGKIKVNLIAIEDMMEYYNAGYYPDYGYEFNADITLMSGWGPDYGDPLTYLSTMDAYGDASMMRSLGLN